MNDPVVFPVKVEGIGTVTPPPGMTVEDMERLAREADEQRRAAAQTKED